MKQNKVPAGCLIAGEWMTAEQSKERVAYVNPATEEVAGYLPVASRETLDKALATAERGFALWSETDAWTRSQALRKTADLLRARADEVASYMTEEQGKPLAEARVEVMISADTIDWFADETRRIYGRTVDGRTRANRLLVIRQAVGPVAAFTPWNFPCLLPARKLAASLAAGCSVILKPAEETPRTACALAQCFLDAGVAKEAIAVVMGRPAEISKHLIASPIIRKVSLTGSVGVGKELLRLAADRIIPTTLELGGHAPVLVFEDADIELAVDMVARGKFRNNGQVCIAPSRLFVHKKVSAEFTRRFVERVRAFRIGVGTEEGVEIGPLANPRRLEAAQALIGDAVAKGARVECGGKRMARKGYFFEPTVLTQVTKEMKIMSEEPFCPLAPIIEFENFDDVLAQANATEFGLASYLFTRNTRTAFLAAEKLETGMVGVNTVAISTAEAPFGGIKMSGFGREGGAEGIESYMVTKYINILL